MLEDTLIYDPPFALPFAQLLAADLEEDGLEFYLRMSRDKPRTVQAYSPTPRQY